MTFKTLLGLDFWKKYFRAHLEESSKAERSFFRTILMVGFHLLVRIFAVATIRDTQCGFKLFTRAAVARVRFLY